MCILLFSLCNIENIAGATVLRMMTKVAGAPDEEMMRPGGCAALPDGFA
jgi:hypothetical protein